MKTTAIILSTIGLAQGQGLKDKNDVWLYADGGDNWVNYVIGTSTNEETGVEEDQTYELCGGKY
jgi:hypothetical protein